MIQHSLHPLSEKQYLRVIRNGTKPLSLARFLSSRGLSRLLPAASFIWRGLRQVVQKRGLTSGTLSLPQNLVPPIHLYVVLSQTQTISFVRTLPSFVPDNSNCASFLCLLCLCSHAISIIPDCSPTYIHISEKMHSFPPPSPPPSRNFYQPKNLPQNSNVIIPTQTNQSHNQHTKNNGQHQRHPPRPLRRCPRRSKTSMGQTLPIKETLTRYATKPIPQPQSPRHAKRP